MNTDGDAGSRRDVVTEQNPVSKITSVYVIVCAFILVLFTQEYRPKIRPRAPPGLSRYATFVFFPSVVGGTANPSEWLSHLQGAKLICKSSAGLTRSPIYFELVSARFFSTFFCNLRKFDFFTSSLSNFLLPLLTSSLTRWSLNIESDP